MSYFTYIQGSYVQDLTYFVDNFPIPGETIHGTFSNGPGGKGSNQAVACYRSGGNIFYRGAISKDIYGEYAKNFYKEEGIPSYFYEIEDSVTGTAGIIVNSDSQNQIVVAIGSNKHFPCCNKLQTFLLDHNIQLIATQLETNLESVYHLISIAKELNIPIILNPAPFNKELELQALLDCTLITPNETEFADICINYNLYDIENKSTFIETIKNYDTDEWLELLNKTPFNQLIITLGSKGSIYYNKNANEVIHTPCIDITPIDSTGAGDAFMGGLCSGLELYHFDLKEAIKYATIVSGLSVTKKGTAPSMPTVNEINKYLD